MRVLVIGASGRTGRLVVEHALGHGHDVRAFSRSETSALHPRLEVVQGDVTDFEAVSSAVMGQTAVVIAVGSAPGVHEAAAANVVHAMALHGVTRLAALSAAGAFARGDTHLSIGFRALIATSLRSTYDDLEAMERRIMASALDWTIVRPVGLSDGEPTGHYRVSIDGSIPKKVSRIARADVASVLMKAVETDTYRRRAIVVAT